MRLMWAGVLVPKYGVQVWCMASKYGVSVALHAHRRQGFCLIIVTYCNSVCSVARVQGVMSPLARQGYLFMMASMSASLMPTLTAAARISCQVLASKGMPLLRVSLLRFSGSPGTITGFSGSWGGEALA